jgi:hypothetical protein
MFTPEEISEIAHYDTTEKKIAALNDRFNESPQANGLKSSYYLNDATGLMLIMSRPLEVPQIEDEDATIKFDCLTPEDFQVAENFAYHISRFLAWTPNQPVCLGESPDGCKGILYQFPMDDAEAQSKFDTYRGNFFSVSTSAA